MELKNLFINKKLPNKMILSGPKGIGKAIASRMAEQGAQVVVSSRNQELCDEVAGEINEGDQFEVFIYEPPRWLSKIYKNSSE